MHDGSENRPGFARCVSGTDGRDGAGLGWLSAPSSGRRSKEQNASILATGQMMLNMHATEMMLDIHA